MNINEIKNMVGSEHFKNWVDFFSHWYDLEWRKSLRDVGPVFQNMKFLEDLRDWDNDNPGEKLSVFCDTAMKMTTADQELSYSTKDLEWIAEQADASRWNVCISMMFAYATSKQRQNA